MPILLLISCENDVDELSGQELVVEAYLYTGKKIEHVKVNRFDTYGRAMPVSDAIVTINCGYDEVKLIPSSQKGWYHYPGSDIHVEDYNFFKIHVEHNKDVAHAYAVKSIKPKAIMLENDSLFISDTIVYGMMVDWHSILTIDPEESHSFIQIHPLSTSRPVDASNTAINFFKKPFAEKKVVLTTGDFKYFGRHTIYVYGVSEQYASMYEANNPLSVKPAQTSFIQGKGVFEVFDYDSIQIEIISLKEYLRQKGSE